MSRMDEVNLGFYQELEKFKEYAKPLLKLKEGDNIVVIDLVDGWETIRTRFGESLRITVKDEDGNDYIMLIKKNSRLYRALMMALVQYVREHGSGIKKAKVKITRYGSGTATVYNVKVLEDQTSDAQKDKGKKK